MFVDFFYTLRKVGIPVTPTAFLRLHKALHWGWSTPSTICTPLPAPSW